MEYTENGTMSCYEGELVRILQVFEQDGTALVEFYDGTIQLAPVITDDTTFDSSVKQGVIVG